MSVYEYIAVHLNPRRGCYDSFPVIPDMGERGVVS